MVLNGFCGLHTLPSPFCPAVGAARGGALSAHFDSRRGGRGRWTPKRGAQPRGRLFPVVLHRFLQCCTLPSSFPPAMATRGGGCATTPYRTPPPGDSAIPE